MGTERTTSETRAKCRAIESGGAGMGWVAVNHGPGGNHNIRGKAQTIVPWPQVNLILSGIMIMRSTSGTGLGFNYTLPIAFLSHLHDPYN